MVKKAQQPHSTGFHEVWLDSLEKNGFSIDEGRYARSSGGEVAYLLIEHPDKNKLSILFHGTGNDQIFTWQALIEALLKAGRSVLTFDLDGHGVKSSSTLVRQNFWQSADDLYLFLKVRGLDAYPYELVGYSLGALLALQATSQHTLRPSRVVIIALPLRIKLSLRFLWNELLTLFSPSFYRHWHDYGWRLAIPAFGSFRRRSFPLRLDPRFRGSYPEMVDLLLQDQAPLALINSSSHNYLLIFGKQDALAPTSDIGQWQSSSGNLKIVVIDRANHFLLPFQRQTNEAITHVE